MCSVIPHADTEGVCDRCGVQLVGRQQRWCSQTCSTTYTREHLWSWARKAAVKRDRRRCITCGSQETLEVNHIIPRVGQGYGFGCWNHQANLETLCHTCHVKVTNAQREARATANNATSP